MTELRSLLLTPASQIPTRRQSWLWENRIPLGTTTIFAGRGGEGKSTFALYLAALVNKGELSGDLTRKPSPVLIISHEDDWSTVMNPRLIGAGANLDAVYRLSVEMTVDEITSETVPAFPIDVQLIRDAVAETGARMILIDPITSTIGGDLHKVTDVRRALDPLNALAQELEISIIGIMHFNKGSGNASDKLSGSHGFRDAVRSVLLFATDEETEQRVVTIDKSNYSEERGSSFAFNLVSTPVYTDDGACSDVGAVQYLGDTDVTVNDIINRTAAGDEPEGDDAESWLTSFLTDNGGSAPAKQIMASSLKDGFSKATIQRVGKRLCDKSSSGFQGSWTWTLKQGSHQGFQGSQLPERENHENHGENLGVVPSGRTLREGGEGGTPEKSATLAAIAARAGLLCPVCGEGTGPRYPGYCDALDTAHANYRADLAVTA